MRRHRARNAWRRQPERSGVSASAGQPPAVDVHGLVAWPGGRRETAVAWAGLEHVPEIFDSILPNEIGLGMVQ